MQDSYEDDDDAIACSASKNASVKDGSLVFTMNIANDIAELKDNIIIFKKHYEGDIIRQLYTIWQ